MIGAQGLDQLQSPHTRHRHVKDRDGKGRRNLAVNARLGAREHLQGLQAAVGDRGGVPEIAQVSGDGLGNDGVVIDHQDPWSGLAHEYRDLRPHSLAHDRLQPIMLQ